MSSGEQPSVYFTGPHHLLGLTVFYPQGGHSEVAIGPSAQRQIGFVPSGDLDWLVTGWINRRRKNGDWSRPLAVRSGRRFYNDDVATLRLHRNAQGEDQLVLFYDGQVLSYANSTAEAAPRPGALSAGPAAALVAFLARRPRA